MSILVSILVFGVIVLVHEFGHYIAAVKSGVLVEEFAIGMGPKIIGFQKGETLFSIRALPLGGYCKMFGENGIDEEEDSDKNLPNDEIGELKFKNESEKIKIDENRAFVSKKVSSRILIVVAGVLMNFLLAIILQFVVTVFEPIPVNLVHKVEAGSAAEKAGIEKGDTILSYNGKKYSHFNDLRFAILTSDGSEVEVAYRKPSGEVIRKLVKPDASKIENQVVFLLGFQPSYKETFLTKKYYGEEFSSLSDRIVGNASASDYFVYSISEAFSNVKMVYYGLKQMITLQLPKDSISGPIGIVSYIGDTYNENIKYGVLPAVIGLLNMTIMLSVNLGVMNLLPLPALDGGRLVFLIIELLRGKPVPQEKESLVHIAGFIVLMVIAVIVTYNDIIRLINL